MSMLTRVSVWYMAKTTVSIARLLPLLPLTSLFLLLFLFHPCPQNISMMSTPLDKNMAHYKNLVSILKHMLLALTCGNAVRGCKACLR